MSAKKRWCAIRNVDGRDFLYRNCYNEDTDQEMLSITGHFPEYGFTQCEMKVMRDSPFTDEEFEKYINSQEAVETLLNSVKKYGVEQPLEEQ